MPKKSLIDDVEIAEEDDKGRPILFTNQEIRRMLTLAGVGSKDVFWDLGCGWGQNLIVALMEFEKFRGFEWASRRMLVGNGSARNDSRDGKKAARRL